MVRHSRKNRRGGDKLDDIQKQLDNIQEEVNNLKSSTLTSVSDEFTEESPIMEEPMKEVINKTWVDDKNKKFNDGAGGRVSLSFPRLISLIDTNISKGNTKKDWTTIKKELNDAESVNGVQDIINKYSISFSSNYVAGTRKRRRHGKRRTHRRH
jgi:hypothetical protein